MTAMNENWKLVSECLPPIEELVWLHEDGETFVGGRFDNDADGWLWNRAHGSLWCLDGCWKGHSLEADDISPSCWAPLILPPGFLEPREFELDANGQPIWKEDWRDIGVDDKK